MTWIIVSKSGILKRKSYNIFCSWFHTVSRHKITYILIWGGYTCTSQGQIDLFLLFTESCIVLLQEASYRSHPFKLSLLVVGRASYLKTYLARTPSHIFILVVHVWPNFLRWAADCRRGKMHIIHIAVVTLFRLLSHLQISPKVKEGGERRGKEWRRQREEISKKSVPEISIVFQFKKNGSGWVKKWNEKFKFKKSRN